MVYIAVEVHIYNATRSGMSWTIEGGQVILDLRVIWLSYVWDEVPQRYLAAKPMPVLT